MGLDRLSIRGSQILGGEIEVSGSKNASLAIMSAVLLVHGAPQVGDIGIMRQIFIHLGAEVTLGDNTMSIQPQNLQPVGVPVHLARQIRGTILLLGPVIPVRIRQNATSGRLRYWKASA